MSGESQQAAGQRGMFGRIVSVGGLTLVSRFAGFIRDIVLAAVLGAGPIADAFIVAQKLPNHFRAIFAEGAFNAAFVPSYTHVRTQGGAAAAARFAGGILFLLLASQILLLAAALLFTPGVIALLAPGFLDDPTRYPLAVALTRITFPYLLLMTLVTLFSGMLNAVNRFAAAAAAPILLNVSMIAALALAALFPSAGHAAAWGVLVAGVLELLLVGAAARRAGILAWPRWPRWDESVRRFFRALAPATVGSAGVQLAVFADTIIVTFLSVGAVSALYYADRINQLPIGIIGIAAGTVVLPEMARRIAAGDERGAAQAQARAVEMTLALALPFLAGFLIVPELIMRALFLRGAFTAADAAASGATLRAYAVGLLPFVLIRSLVATFFARGDTATPVKASLAAVAVNVALKVALMGPLAQVGLALATAIGGWVNVALVLWFAARHELLRLDRAALAPLLRLAAVGGALAAVIWCAHLLLDRMLDPLLGAVRGRDQIMLGALAFIGTIVYATGLLLVYRARWRSLLAGARARRGRVS